MIIPEWKSKQQSKVKCPSRCEQHGWSEARAKASRKDFAGARDGAKPSVANRQGMITKSFIVELLIGMTVSRSVRVKTIKLNSLKPA
mgnify:CR=1 FL=1